MQLAIEFHPTTKQGAAWYFLHDKQTTEILFGGGAGGGKSKLGCIWLILSAWEYPGTRWMLGRSVLKHLKESTLVTFFDTLSEWKVTKDEYKYDQNAGIITFRNASQIILKDLAHYPSDPNYDSLGSTEYTGGFVDEANQITERAKEVIASRIRYKLTEHNLIPKLLLSCNPAKSWVYNQFYKPYKDFSLEPHKAFVQALVTDNPHISPHYIENLRKLKDKTLKERLLFGNWEYDDDPNALFSYDVISDLFTNTIDDTPEIFMTVDVARFGADKTTLGIWRGLKLIDIKVMDRSKTTEVVELMGKWGAQYKVPRSHEIADEDGVGGGVVDMRGCKGFVGGSSAFQDKQAEYKVNYQNLRSQCFYTLADYAQRRVISLQVENSDYKQFIMEELEQIKSKDADKDGKLKIVSKEDIKEHLGRSTDFADMLMMRMFFEVVKQPEPSIRWM